MNTEKRIWFPAKRYGWGWGLPCCWQGWLVLAIYLGLVIGSAFWLRENIRLYVAVALLSSLLFVGFCWLKGEKPRYAIKCDASTKYIVVKDIVKVFTDLKIYQFNLITSLEANPNETK